MRLIAVTVVVGVALFIAGMAVLADLDAVMTRFRWFVFAAVVVCASVLIGVGCQPPGVCAGPVCTPREIDEGREPDPSYDPYYDPAIENCNAPDRGC